MLWLGIVEPLWSWYGDRNELLEQRQALLQRMQALAASLPALRAASADKRDEGSEAATSMLPGTTDAVAAADLQERVQKMAAAAGVSLTAVETLPAEAAAELAQRLAADQPERILAGAHGPDALDGTVVNTDPH